MKPFDKKGFFLPIFYIILPDNPNLGKRMNYILFDDNRREYLLPLTYFRPVADIRFGILTIRQKWENYLLSKTSTLTEDYLSKKFPLVRGKESLLINGGICPNKELLNAINKLESNQTLAKGETIIAMRLTFDDLDKPFVMDELSQTEVQCEIPYTEIYYPWDIFHQNDVALKADFELLTKGKQSQPLSKTNTVIGNGNLFIEKGAVIEGATLNASAGPIYIGKSAEIMEGCLVRGPFAMLEHSTLKMGAKIYGATTIGPYSKIGGEVNNSVFFGYSNKAHDGFIGNSVIAEWCNFGAGTNNSNLKNTYDNIKLWCYPERTFIDTGLQFCGLIMGDHSKCGINTMFNTGTVVGVSCNIFGAGFPRNFIPSFSWGGTSGFLTYNLKKALNVAFEVYQRRNVNLDDIDKEIFSIIFDHTLQFRQE